VDGWADDEWMSGCRSPASPPPETETAPQFPHQRMLPRQLVSSPKGIRNSLMNGQWRSAFRRLIGRLRTYLIWPTPRLANLRASLTGGPIGGVGQYGRKCSRVRKHTLDPVWKQWLECRLEGGAVNEKGVYDNPDAPYTSLRLEVWDNDRLSRDDFIGEVSLPLIALMDARTHSYTMPLTDPEGRTGAESGVSGEISFELKYES